jgi:hypothetical protein
MLRRNLYKLAMVVDVYLVVMMIMIRMNSFLSVPKTSLDVSWQILESDVEQDDRNT